MPDRKSVTAFGIAFLVFSAIYAVVAWRTGGSPGLFIPSALLFLSWSIGKVIAESLSLKDPAKWQRSMATIGAMVAATAGLGFLVVTHHQFAPLELPARSVVELVSGYLAVTVGFALPRFRWGHK